jgi:hypothetical protein
MKQAAELKSKMEAMGPSSTRLRSKASVPASLPSSPAKGEMKGVKIDDPSSSRRRRRRETSSSRRRDARRPRRCCGKMSVAGGLPLPPGLKLF